MKDYQQKILVCISELLNELHNTAVVLDTKINNNGIEISDEENAQLTIDFRITEEEIRDCLLVLTDESNIQKVYKSTTCGDLYNILKTKLDTR